MKRSICWTTSDGVVHHEFAMARRHADNRYGKALTDLAHALCKCDGKYVKILAALELASDSGLFSQIEALKADIAEDNHDE